jgi:hypothetical protein
MKILTPSNSRLRQRQSGMAVIVILALLALVLGFIAVNFQALSSLHGELKLIEQRQIRRLNHSATNAPARLSGGANTNYLAAPATPLHE